jgi:hypothetical protein
MNEFDNDITTRLVDSNAGDTYIGDYVDNPPQVIPLDNGKRNAGTGHSFGNTALPSQRVERLTQADSITTNPLPPQSESYSRSVTGQTRGGARGRRQQKPAGSIFNMSRKGSSCSPVKPINVKEYQIPLEDQKGGAWARHQGV